MNPLRAELAATPLAAYYHSRVWKQTYYQGVRVLKAVQDLWNYQEILFEHQTRWVIETGTRHGGSALWFADQLYARGRVITIDIDQAANEIPRLPMGKRRPNIKCMEGSSTDPAIVDAVQKLLEAIEGHKFIILDSDHSREHVLAELTCYVPLMSAGDYLVVEDTTHAGPWAALTAFNELHPGMLRPDAQRNYKFGITFAPDGYYIRT